jgi:hypothetical protein
LRVREEESMEDWLEEKLKRWRERKEKLRTSWNKLN